MTWTVSTYLAYLILTVPLTVGVATTLSRNGRVFLDDVFDGDSDLARAVNTLLVVGFYLLNLGLVVLFLSVDQHVADLADLFDALSVKVGVVMLTLGLAHFLNVWVFNAIRRRGRLEKMRRDAPAPPPYLPYPPAPPAAYPR